MSQVSQIIWKSRDLIEKIEFNDAFLDKLTFHHLVSTDRLKALKDKYGESKRFPYELLKEIDNVSNADNRFYELLVNIQNLEAALIMRGSSTSSLEGVPNIETTLISRRGSNSGTRSMEVIPPVLSERHEVHQLTDLPEVFSPAPALTPESNNNSDGATLSSINCASSGERDNSDDSPSPEIQYKSEVTVTPGTQEFQGHGIYPLSPGLYRGKALIVNFEEFVNGEKFPKMNGSQRDVDNLDSLLDQMGFKVRLVQTKKMTRNDFSRTMMDFSEEEHGDIMVLVVMSHGVPGGGSGKIITSNCEKVDIEQDIIQ